ncbi:BadF/BadG/BcrA/BcrD ATPase family protein [uncultured Tateyamaria sp.]|uniref:BadF/BadG/BcrA/BcrD ATPase family protein n=1 Tax=uncultured Tateyamaria sp. TaxID=455651 RepID=UPI00262AC7EF|nr:BadF/BadG/BcrA/BcrD ATPase family protein [uncultured Tateyamaria sp.]
MTDSPNTSVLAVDGGGTRCRFALQTAQGRVVAEAGPANVSTDFDGAVRRLQDGIAALAGLADTSVETLYDLPAFVGLAGATGPAEVQRLKSKLPLQNVCYADDRRAALRGALGQGDGFVAHCGTGSFFAAQTGGKERFGGGWGATLGDEASAQWVGRKALTQYLREVDGFAPASALVGDLKARFQSAERVAEFARSARPADFGTIAPHVTVNAKSGDAVALAILQAGADHIAFDLRQMGWTPGLTICLTGGIGPHYAPYMPDDMKPDLAEPLGQPLDGAIALAREMEMTHGHC